MRVVGGKTGADGRLFAYIVWTVHGGPADKAGLQRGDKVNANHYIRFIYVRISLFVLFVVLIL